MQEFFGLILWLIQLVILAAVLVGFAYVRYTRKDKEGERPKDAHPNFVAWLPTFARQYVVRLLLSLAAFLFAGGVIAGAIVGLLILFDVPILNWQGVKGSVANSIKAEAQSIAQWLAKLGATHADRVHRIEEIFAERVETIEAVYVGEFMGLDKNRGKYVPNFVAAKVNRSLGNMDNREREYLRIVELLNSAAEGRDRQYLKWRAALVWGDGKGREGWLDAYLTEENSRTTGLVATMVKELNASVDQTVTAVNDHLNTLRQDPAMAGPLKEVVAESFERISHGAAGWLAGNKLKDTVFEPQSEHVLHLGSFQDGTPLSYSGDGSMISIAPPGSGKTQCHVFPNLLSWKGPAVVLDISGDIYEHTSKWRAENVGPVYKFSPLEPESSHCYNPLAFVRREADYIWEDARLLAEMMIVPSSASDPFWENEARTVLTAAIAHVCYANPPESRPMHDVLDIMYGGEAWNRMILGLKMAVDVRVMMQNANALAGMNEKTLSSVLQTARSSLSAWTGERIARATRTSDWNPLDLRGGGNPTIYIYIRPNEVESYLSLLRVFIGQHIRVLTGGAVPPRGATPILFMLDELPRLRHMPPVDEALNIGRKYGLRLWMFAQSVGQLQEAYKNADGMLGSCAVRAYMNPSGADGQAEKLSEQIGNIDSLADGQRKRLVEAADLAGPAYRDQIIVFGLNARPARVRKDPAWKNEELKQRMGACEPTFPR